MSGLEAVLDLVPSLDKKLAKKKHEEFKKMMKFQAAFISEQSEEIVLALRRNRKSSLRPCKGVGSPLRMGCRRQMWKEEEQPTLH